MKMMWCNTLLVVTGLGVRHVGVHLEVRHEVALAHVAHAAQVAGVRAVVLVRHHVVHERRLLAEPPRAEVARPRPHCRVLVLDYMDYIYSFFCDRIIY